jgi:hypothetical protein
VNPEVADADVPARGRGRNHRDRQYRRVPAVSKQDPRVTPPCAA